MNVWKPLAAAAVVAGLAAVGGTPAVAAPDAPTGATTGSPLKRYQARLETEARRILAPEVQGAMKDALARRGTDLWASLSIASWQKIVTTEAPALSRSCQVLARRSEVIWTEERLADAYASPIVQMASVHAFQRALGGVLALLGVKMAPPASGLGSTGAAAATAPAAMRGPVVAIAAAPRPTPAKRAAIVPAPAAPVLSPAELAAYTATLERESYRILTHEVEGAVLDGVVARRSPLRTATTVAAWKAALMAAHPDLAKAAAVLERRAEVLRGEHRVLDAYESVATQKAAIRGLQNGLEKILRQFGK